MKFKLNFEITKEKFKRPLCTYYRGNISSLCLSYDQISMPRECVGGWSPEAVITLASSDYNTRTSDRIIRACFEKRQWNGSRNIKKSIDTLTAGSLMGFFFTFWPSELYFLLLLCFRQI